jgi:DNA-binding CsgD family transcriptional regulator
MLGRTTDFLHVDKRRRQKFQEHLYPAIDKQGFFHLPEFEMKRKDGTVFPTEHTVVSLEDEQGKRIGWVSVVRDISERKLAEKALRKRESELLVQAQHLEEVNAALKVLLKRREEDKTELGDNILANVKELVLPYLEKLKKSQSEPHQMTLVDILESNLKDIVSPFATKLSSRYLNLTPTEIRVASLIRDGRTAKEIADLLHLSVNTIRTHRYNIRSKLGLKNRKINLRSYLRSFQNE